MHCWQQTSLTPYETAWSGPVSITTGQTTSSLSGSLVGFYKNMRYGIANDTGTLQTQLFRDIRVPSNPVTVRIVGIVVQSNAWLVLAWETVPGITPTPAMPQFTNRLTVDGTKNFLISSGTKAGVTTPSIGVYWAAKPILPWTIGSTHNIQFT